INDDLWLRNMVANFGPHKKAQSHSAGDGESYARRISMDGCGVITYTLGLTPTG
ncbi:jg17298, partial [Pararge aegeria aegeria]